MSSALNATHLRQAALIYMDRSGGLEKFIEDCKKYNESTHSYAVYRFVISINPMDITEVNATLGNHILHEPMRAAQIFQSVCDAAIRTLCLIEQYQTEAQINVVLKLTHLPELPGYRLSLSDYPLDYRSQRLYMMEGTVTAMSTVTKYTQGARFLCSETRCPFSQDFQYIRVHVPGATELATVGKVFVCDLCTSPLKEDVKYRVLGDKQVVELMDAKSLCVLQGQCVSQQNCRFQSYAVFVRGSLKITRAFQDIHSKTLTSPWMFTGILANIFASQVVPVGTYNTLKLCLLLSLVQTCNEDKDIGNNLDLLVVTSDALIVERLMSYSVCLLPRGVRHTPFNDLFATVTKEEHGTGTAIIHAGSALMAKGGVCFTGDINSHKKDKLDHLMSALESRNTAVFIPGKKYGEDVNQQIFISLQCNFWAYATSLSKKNNPRENLFIGQADLSMVPANLVDAFGILVHCNESSHRHPVVPLIHHSLTGAVRPGSHLCPASEQFTTQDFEELISYAKNLNVAFSSRAETVLHGYYLASRRVRTDMSGSKISTSALRHLSSMAEAHAKLSLRREVTEEDALVAILLFEDSLTLKHGSSVFSVSQNPLFPAELVDESSLHQRDTYLRKCHQQLLQFISTYGPGFVSEE
ncbi:minichromosome maintenance domain-containing protein 2 isoform X2 [Hyperolius riggenbachi]|uniref:minichromosome maintenance domain-containing protein 2 isoform X2 n=1 Tax=Hyperolius riggenbachi TaxID=752182 RepID=UPI0035A2E36F